MSKQVLSDSMCAGGQVGGNLMSATANQREQLLVVESSGVWTRLIRRAVGDSLRLTTHPSFGKSDALPPVAVCSLLVLENGDEDAALEWAVRTHVRHPRTLVMAVGLRDRDSVWLLRCGGATIVDDRCDWPILRVVHLTQRFWRNLPSPTLSLEQRIWKNLPWHAPSM